MQITELQINKPRPKKLISEILLLNKKIRGLYFIFFSRAYVYSQYLSLSNSSSLFGFLFVFSCMIFFSPTFSPTLSFFIYYFHLTLNIIFFWDQSALFLYASRITKGAE